MYISPQLVLLASIVLDAKLSVPDPLSYQSVFHGLPMASLASSHELPST
jgi:hypothetical protein